MNAPEFVPAISEIPPEAKKKFDRLIERARLAWRPMQRSGDEIVSADGRARYTVDKHGALRRVRG